MYRHMAGFSKEQIEKEFIDLIESPTSTAEYIRGEWCVAFFEGVYRDRVRSDMNYSDTSRDAHVQNPSQLTELQSSSRRQLDAHYDQLGSLRTVASAGAPVTQAMPSDQPAPPVYQDLASLSINREVIIYIYIYVYICMD